MNNKEQAPESWKKHSSPEGKSCAEGVGIKERKAVEHRAGKTSKAVQELEYEGEKKCLK